MASNPIKLQTPMILTTLNSLGKYIPLFIGQLHLNFL